jgi:polysaccharide pyruvyl transferase WcaK-like protein
VLSSAGYQLRLVCMAKADLQLMKLLQADLRLADPSLRIPLLHPRGDQVPSAFAGCAAGVVTRFHALAGAAVAGVPSVPIIYEEKVRELAIALGLTEYVVESQGGRLSATAVEEKINLLMNNRQAVTVRLRKRVQEMHRDAYRHVEGLKDALGLKRNESNLD